MKFIHTADIHLDSPLIGVADGKTRRFELVKAVANLADYADNNGVEVVVVAGDLFDDKFVADQTIRSVADIISNCKARWLVLKGNHGDATPYNKLHEICNTVSFFGDNWTTYRLGNVVFCGKELDKNDNSPWTLPLADNDYNVVVLHGDVDSDEYGHIDGKALAAAPVKYVALGHRHSLQKVMFGRNTGMYSGTLEARGFDENEPTGFVVVDTDKNEVRFVPQAIRSVITKDIDLSKADSDVAVQRIVTDAVAEVAARNYLNVILRGNVAGGIRAKFVAEQYLKDKFFALRIQDDTKPVRDLAKIAEEVSLKGEFVKLAMGIADEAERNRVLDMGLAALDGEDLQ